MRAAQSSGFIAVVYALTAIFGSLTAARAVASALPPPSGSGEAAAWFVGSLALVGVSVALVVVAGRREAEERRRTHRERACQAQRNATIFSETLLALNTGGAVAMLLPLVNAGPYAPSLTTHAALTLVLATAWYVPSTIPYAPLPRLPSSSAKH